MAQAPDKLNSGSAVKALIEMARQRGLYVSEHEAEQAWSGVVVQRENERLGAAWTMLFAGHSVAPSPVKLLSVSQLPVWVVSGSAVGIVTAQAGGEFAVEWMAGCEPEQPNEIPEQALVPVAPVARSEESFLPEKQRGLATQAIVSGIKAHSSIFKQVVVASSFINIIAVLSSLFVMQVYDRVVPNFAYATLWYLAAGLAAAYIFDFVLKMVRMRLLDASSKQLDEALSLYIFDKLLSLKLDKRPSRLGSLVSQVRDYESIKAFFTSSTLFTLVDLPFILVFIGVIAAIGGPVAIVPAVFLVLCLVAGAVAYRPISRLQRENNDAITRRQGLLYEAVAGGDVIKAQGGEAQFGDRWLSASRETADRSISLNAVSSVASFVTQFLQQSAYAGIVVVGVYVIEAGELTMGGLIACSILGGRTLGNIAGVSGLLLRWHHASYSLGILNDLLATPADDDPGRQGNVQTQPLDLEIKDAVYSYQGSELPQLVVPAMKIDAGERVVVLGKNGSGKSTLLKLLAGIATPSRGEVRVAGLNFESCRPSWLRENIGYLPQEPRLFAGTLLDNLTLGMSMPDEEKIFSALRKTGLYDAVDKHPKGLQLEISEGGAGLSGGQRQLLGIARMVLQNPKIWLLDEPAASLDSEVEVKIMELIRSLPEDRTVVFISHKRSWISLADRVLLVESGQVKVDAPTNDITMGGGTPPATQSREVPA